MAFNYSGAKSEVQKLKNYVSSLETIKKNIENLKIDTSRYWSATEVSEITKGFNNIISEISKVNNKINNLSSDVLNAANDIKREEDEKRKLEAEKNKPR